MSRGKNELIPADTQDAKAIKMYRIMQIYLAAMNGVMAALFLVVLPMIHFNMPEQNRMLVGFLCLAMVPLDIIIMQVIIAKRKKRMLGDDAQSIAARKW